MVTKTFRSESMLKALQMVQEELGADAIVVSTREIPAGPSWNPWKHSAVEVIAARAEAVQGIKNTTNGTTTSISTANRDKVQGAGGVKVTTKPSGKAPVLRPAANSQGVEFVEEIPEIEWVDHAEEKPAPTTRNFVPQRTKEPVSTTKHGIIPGPGRDGLIPVPGRERDYSSADENQKLIVERPLEHELRSKTAQYPVIIPSPVRPLPADGVTTSIGITNRVMQTTPMTLPEEKDLPMGLKKIFTQLTNQGVDRSLISGLMNVALETLSNGILTDYETCKKYITQLLSAELRVQQGLGVYVSSNVVCLLGASGSGKTSSIAKLALFFGQKLNKNIIWVCADTVRMGAIAEARAYTDALGLSLKLVYRPEDLKEILAAAQDTDLFLLDTQGYNPCSESQMVELGALLAEIPKRFTYLVAPATTKETDLFQLSASLGVFNLDGLIITKLDETHGFGSVYNFSRKNQVPLGFFTTGKETSRNLELVDPTRLVSALFGKEWTK